MKLILITNISNTKRFYGITSQSALEYIKNNKKRPRKYTNYDLYDLLREEYSYRHLHPEITDKEKLKEISRELIKDDHYCINNNKPRPIKHKKKYLYIDQLKYRYKLLTKKKEGSDYDTDEPDDSNIYNF